MNNSFHNNPHYPRAAAIYALEMAKRGVGVPFSHLSPQTMLAWIKLAKKQPQRFTMRASRAVMR